MKHGDNFVVISGKLKGKTGIFLNDNQDGTCEVDLLISTLCDGRQTIDKDMISKVTGIIRNT